jgi:NTE family protein
MWEALRSVFLGKPSAAKVGLALSGGGARGLAHIGVLKVFAQEEVPIDLLAGTSAGGLIAAAYAAGLSADDLEREALRLANPRHLLSLVDRTLPRRGLLTGQKVTEYLAQWLGGLTFDQLRVPLALVAVDLDKEQKVVLREGSVLEAVRATIALPGLFAPLEKDGQLLVDGGLVDNLPTDVVHQMGADVVIAVDIATDVAAVASLAEGLQRNPFMPDALVETVSVLWRSLSCLTREINRRVLEEAPPDLLICPAIPPAVTAITGLTHAAEVIAAGEQAAREAMPRLRELLA